MQTAADHNSYQRPYRILIADDDDFMHSIIKISLRKTNYLLAFAKDGAEALRMIRKDPPDIVIADALMPVRSGFELIEDLKADPQTCEIPVILLTALEASNIRFADCEFKAELCLAKPFKVDSILDCIKQAEQIVESRKATKAEVNRTETGHFFIKWRLSR